MSDDKKLAAVLLMTGALAEAIRDLGSVPSGELYARVMGHIDIITYNLIIDLLKKRGWVKEQAHLLTWIGPKKQ